MRMFRFDNAYESRWMEIQLRDLAVALCQTKILNVDFRVLSLWSPRTRTLTISTLFESLSARTRMQVQKSDVYLRAIGNRQWTNFADVQWFHRQSGQFKHPQFVRQLFCAWEDFRLMSQIAAVRPGTVPEFQARVDVYAKWLLANREKRKRDGAFLDVLFTDLYIHLHKPYLSGALIQRDTTAAASSAEEWVISAVHHAYMFWDPLPMNSTLAVVEAVIDYYQSLKFDEHMRVTDMSTNVFDMDWSGDVSTTMPEDEEKVVQRRDSRKSESISTDGHTDNADAQDMESWNERSESDAPGAFLMNHEQNEASPVGGTQTRVGNDDVEAFTTRRGHAGKGRQEEDDYGEDDTVTNFDSDLRAQPSVDRAIGSQDVPRRAPDAKARAAVRNWEAEVYPIKRRLERTLNNTLLHRTQFRQRGKRHGRLDKRLTKIVTEPHPRLFYHKADDDRQIDAAVQFLVDCSGSMFERLDNLKPYLYLMHDMMRKMRVSHDVCGFWEDTDNIARAEKPKLMTNFCHVVTWNDCFRPNVSEYLEQLEPQLDNRDGLAIRTIGQSLLKRNERQKWLLVLSDGEPAADDYPDAIYDTKNAIRLLRHCGIHIVHLCISENAMDLREAEILRQLYTNGSIVIHGIDQLPNAVEKTMINIMKETSW